MLQNGSFVGPCYKCRSQVWLPQALYEAAKHSPKIGFWCAYGHEQIFAEGETEETKLRRERDRLTQQMAQKNDEIKELSLLLATERAALRKIGTRVAKGVCPCCNRSFVKLAAHMKIKHPDFQAAA